MIGRRAVGSAPDLIAETGGGRADIGMAVVSIDAPRAQHALHVAIVSRSPHMIHDLVAPPIDERLPDLCGKSIEYLVPRHALPLPLAALSRPFQRIQNTFRVIDLVNGGRAFCAIASPAPRMVRVALKAADAPRLLIHIRH